MTYQTKAVFTATAGQRDFDVTFPFIAPEHVEVRVNDVPLAFEWIGPARLRLTFPRGEGEIITVRRATPLTPLVTFANGAVLTEQDLNNAVRQTLYVQQELAEQYADGIGKSLARLADGTAINPNNVIDEMVAMALADELLAEFRQRIADIDLNATSITDTALRVDSLQSTVDALANLEDGTGLATVIQTEQEQRIAGDEALAQVDALMGAKSGDSLSFILSLDRVKVSPTESLGQRFDFLTSEINTNKASIQTEAETRATQDSAMASTLALLGARNAAGTAFILDLNKVQVGGGVSMGSRLSGIDTQISNVSSSVVSEQTARTTADSALSQRIDTVSTTVGSHTASITSLQTTTNGLSAKAGIALNVNGHITGWVMNNGGGVGTMAIVSDKFSLVAPNGGNPVTPFVVTAGKVQMNAAVEVNGSLIVNGSVGSPQLQQSAVSQLAYVVLQNNLSLPVGN